MMITLLRIFSYGLQGFRRNFWLSIIAIFTMALTITIVTVSLLADTVVARQLQEFNAKIDYVVFVKDEAADADVDSFYAQVKARPEVASSSYLGKDQVRARFEERLGQIEALKGIITADNNPLPRQVDLHFSSPTQIETLDAFIRQDRFQSIVEDTSYRSNKGLIDQYTRVSSVVRGIGLLMSLFFVVVSVLVILNTIRLAIFARREEIEVMRLVGATPSYIRGPFLIEGSLFGFGGAVFAGLFCYVLMRWIQITLQENLIQGSTNYFNELLGPTFQNIVSQAGFSNAVSQLIAMQILLGVLLGVICSMIAAHRYLRER